MGSTLVCVRRNVQHLELKLPDSTRFAFINVVMAAVSASGPTGCLVSPPPLSSQNLQSRMKALASHRARGETQTWVLRWAQIERVRKESSKASRIQSSQIGSVLVCVRRNVQHCGLKLLDSTRFVLATVMMADVSTSGPTGCLVRPLPLPSQSVCVCVCVCVCVFIKLQMTAQSGPVILVILCYSH